jgi:aminopeptidase
MNLEILKKYAKLAVVKGTNVQKGQLMVISAPVEAFEFTRLCVQEAYKAGASEVIVDYGDSLLSRLKYENVTKERLAEVPDYFVEKRKYYVDQKACFLHIISEVPGNLKGIDSDKVQTAQIAYMTAIKPFRYYTMSSVGQWSIVAYPNVVWAKKVFPNLDEKEAYDRLFEAILFASRINEQDPIENWDKHNAELAKHTKLMNEYNFKSLHFTNELNTDLIVELALNHVWEGGSDNTPSKVEFNANMPTEEVFSMPKRDGVNGIVYASKPLSYQGNLIEDFYLKFENGKVVDYDAKAGKEALTNLLNTDEGSRYLGEVALISYQSPISDLNLLFYNTLFDENASCHLALGAAYPSNLKGGVDLKEEELVEHGANVSMNHCDFMFGSREMKVVGTTFDNKEVILFEHGDFVV